MTSPGRVPLLSFDLAGWLLPHQVQDLPARPYGGRAPLTPPVPVFRGSTAEVQGLYPWLYGAGLPAVGAYLGVDCLTGAAFCCSPLL